jgi:hypothetical protein
VAEFMTVKHSLFYFWRDLTFGRRIIIELLICVTLIVLVEALFFGKAGDFGGAILAGIGFGVFFALINHIAITYIKKSTDE